MTAETAPQLCGYMEHGQVGLPCRETAEQDGYCWTHAEPRYSMCVGCLSNAHTLCQFDGPHSVALCGSCEHKGAPGSGEHGPKDQPAEHAEPSEGVPQGVDAVRRELEETVVLSLRKRAAEGHTLTSNETAALLVSDLAITALLGLVTSLGRQQAAQSGG